jgi:cobalt-precorrin 5A hydrolase/precorrin-3B C17-methyltransferase
MRPVFVAITAEGFATARRAAATVGGEVHAPAPLAADQTVDKVASHLRRLFNEDRAIVGVCAAGILIRVLAPLLSGKRVDPPVLAMSEDGDHVVPLLGGHSGANELARRIAARLGTEAAVTTTGDNRFGVTLDVPPEGWTLANPKDAKSVMAALLGRATARLEGRAPWLEESRIPFADDGGVRLVATTKAMDANGTTGKPAGGTAPAIAGPDLALIYHPRRLAIGIGCERNAEPGEAIALVRETLDQAGLARDSVALVASLDLKADEPAVLAAAEALGVSARFFAAEALEAETPRLETPSDAVFREVGCHGVAEAAALAAAGPQGTLIVPKHKGARVTCAIAEAPEVIDAHHVGRARGRLAILGIGPGSRDWLTPEAHRLLQTSDAAVGYSLYLDLAQPLIAHAERFDSGLGSEEQRVRQALALAGEGRSVALISSGDAGIYAMATLAFECLEARPTFSPGEKMAAKQPDEGVGRARNEIDGGRRIPSPVAFGDTLSPPEKVSDAAQRIEIVVAPGISAMQAAAARAGAPLGHDFCAISLSDLLTPWETIETRIRAAAEADFVIAFYNPVSGRRTTQLAAAKRILLSHRPPDTPVVVARNLGRDGESVTTLPLHALAAEEIDMLTLVIVGASTTRQVDAAGKTWTYTPRGYERKRDAEGAVP